ncbi:hypothetical protein ACFC1R_38250 [Kitasatospora sp. NPDC056138]|uniref:hypothetical protein n=1 Tax=Kitasatospora sp. NPDC056138 TaxID=3345724 RepID=UPI0035D6BC86
MDIIVLNSPDLGSLGTLHVARPKSPGSLEPVELTLCHRPTRGMTVVGLHTTATHETWYPAELTETTARCSLCAAQVYLTG